ncbi:MAG: UDP-N-acetylmuramoyl-tripeptide--D-alanyl-D-alanine ligase [Bacteroidota bacterium]
MLDSSVDESVGTPRMKLMIEDVLKLDHVERKNMGDLSRSIVKGVSTDSRTVRPGDLFFALRGEKFDGHRFLRDAFDKGAVAAVVESAAELGPPDEMRNYPVVVVRSTIGALGKLANLYRTTFNIPIIAITGSNGKTVAKDMVAAVLSTEYRVLSTEGNLNNQIGVPLMLFRLEKDQEMAVIEMGTNHFGEIAHLCEVAEPTYGLITNIGRAHLEFFQSVEGVAKAKGELFEWLSMVEGRQSVAFVNADDPLVLRESERVKNKITFGFESSDVDVGGIYLGMNQQCQPKFEIQSQWLSMNDVIELHVTGRHAIYSALAAVAVGLKFAVKPDQIKCSLEQFTSSKGRMEILKVGGVTILNDTYNSNRDSAIAALQTLAAIRCGGKKIAVLGDMLELGERSIEEHAKVGVVFSDLGLEYLLTFGPHSKSTAAAAKAWISRHFDDKAALIRDLIELVKADDAVLVKGSRGMRMEEVVKALTDEFKE